MSCPDKEVAASLSKRIATLLSEYDKMPFCIMITDSNGDVHQSMKAEPEQKVSFARNLLQDYINQCDTSMPGFEEDF